MNCSTWIIGFFIIILSVIIQVGYYVAWMLCDSYFYPAAAPAVNDGAE